ncbi:tail assembly chaperone [Streptomyces phage AxeJC]|uniref:Tail assembly chaperone n=1 Tax=Streptomyces phage AxeJC TaxID=2926084 RepID=A0A9E7E5Q6_9CAUD|nr:tail assembly chaperone [Streptomyces phage AxeJC]URC17937.1 tail assembly chaperone [Streptomyces phage AxeJC]
MGFGALDAYLDDYLELPVTGRDGVERTYRIEDPPAEDGIRIERITTLAARLVAGGSRVDTQQLDDEQELDLYRMCLGDAYDQLRADLSWGRFKHVALTAMMWITADRETAESYWQTGNVPGKSAESGGASVGVARLLGKGCGEYDEATGLYEWYEGGFAAQPQGAAPPLTWDALLEQWALIEADLHQVYGIDTDSGVLRERSWRWLRARITGLLSAECRVYRHFAPPPTTGQKGGR